jgi:uncharacterized integral membrane protein
MQVISVSVFLVFCFYSYTACVMCWGGLSMSYVEDVIWYTRNMIYLLTAIGLTPSDSSTVHIYTQTIHKTTQLTTLVGRFSGIRTQIGQNKINDKLTV